MKILVTGAAGSIGQHLVPALRELGREVTGTDIDTMDVTHGAYTNSVIRAVAPDVVYHLAGAKHAPEGEESPQQVMWVNGEGTWNVLRACELYAPNAKVILASTCKACDPETAYGASKLIAERMVLNAGGVVVRYYNVRETTGNVFRLWEQIPPDRPIPWTDCRRYFISLEQALSLTVAALDLPSGMYTVNPGRPEWMHDVAARLYPGRELVKIPARRGDRQAEPLCADSEELKPEADGLVRIVGAHDPVQLALARMVGAAPFRTEAA